MFDCQACGACCCNPEENRREGFVDYVEVERRDVLLERPRFTKKFVVWNEAGVPHLRLDGDRCAALRGRLGERVSCAIYDIRPRACRRVEAGSERCQRDRAERGIGQAL